MRKHLFIFILLLSNSLLVQAQEFHPLKNPTSIPELELYLKEQYRLSVDQISKNLTNDQISYLKKNHRARYESSIDLIHKGRITNQGEIYKVVNQLFQEILSSNPDITGNKQVYIINDQSVNAFTMGDDIIYIHIGLLYRIKTFEELILVLCHEIAHNELKHYESKMIDYVQKNVNDSLEKAVKKIFKQEIGHVSALNELYLPWILSSRKQSRDFEFQADSLAIELFNNTPFALRRAYSLYDILKHLEHDRDSIPVNLKKALFLPDTMNFTKHLNYQPEASMGLFEKEEDTLEKYLNTHPFPEERALKFEETFSSIATKSDEREFPKSEFDLFKFNTESEMLYTTFINKNIGRSIYYWISYAEKYPGNEFSNQLLALSFSILGYEKYKRREGLLVEPTSLEFDENYQRVLFFLRKLSPDDCMKLANYYIEKFELDPDAPMTDYTKAFIAGYQKDLATFKRLYIKLKKNEGFDYQSSIEEIYFLNKVNTYKL